ncbi:hypothetical protein Hanom_Chr03g00269581 [Helianthus anomalus]
MSSKILHHWVLKRAKKISFGHSVRLLRKFNAFCVRQRSLRFIQRRRISVASRWTIYINRRLLLIWHINCKSQTSNQNRICKKMYLNIFYLA